MRVHRDQPDRRVLRPVADERLVALAQVHRELHAELHAVVQRADHQLGVHDVDVVAGLDLAGAHLARAGRGQRHALRPLAVHAQRELLDVEHDVGHVLAHARNAAELVQHAVDLHRGDRGALQRRQQDAADRVAERHAEAALQRLGDDGGDRAGSAPGSTSSFSGLIGILPVLLDDGALLHACPFGRASPAAVDDQRDHARPVSARRVRLDAPALARPAAVMRIGVMSRMADDREADRLQARSALPAGAQARSPRSPAVSMPCSAPCARRPRRPPAPRRAWTCGCP